MVNCNSSVKISTNSVHNPKAFQLLLLLLLLLLLPWFMDDGDDDFALTLLLLVLGDEDDDDVKAASLGALEGMRKAGLDAVVVAAVFVVVVVVAVFLLRLAVWVLMSAIPPTTIGSRFSRCGRLNATAVLLVVVSAVGTRKA
jgi:hypothetical protein